MDNRNESVIQSLIEWVEETGRSLPWPPAAIAKFEAMGGVVDLLTGELYPGRADETAVFDLRE